MAKRLFVGSLPYDITDAQLEELFSQAGKVESAKVIIDRYTGRGKGFGFVEMTTEEEAQKAIKTLNGHDLNGRTIIVNEARPQEDRSQRGSSYPRQKRW
jgi:RNA recognition motif-containing protein